MRLYSHGVGHTYWDAGKKTQYGIPKEGYNDLPDEVGAILLEGHPTKLCDVTAEEDPKAHTERCDKSAAFPTTMVEEPPVNRMMVPNTHLSPQKRRLLRDAQKRSRRARMETVGGKG